jgi:hypothetical protein
MELLPSVFLYVSLLLLAPSAFIPSCLVYLYWEERCNVPKSSGEET